MWGIYLPKGRAQCQFNLGLTTFMLEGPRWHSMVDMPTNFFSDGEEEWGEKVKREMEEREREWQSDRKRKMKREREREMGEREMKYIERECRRER